MTLPKKITPRQKIIASISLVVLTTLVLSITIIYPSLKTIIELNDSIYNERVELEKLYRKGQVLKQTLQEYEEVKPHLTKLDKAYIIPGSELEFFTTLEQAADQSNVKQNLKLTSTDPTVALTTLPFELDVQGEFTQILKHLTKLEALDYYINIDTVRLSANRGAYQEPNKPLPSGISAIFLANAFIKP